MRPVARSEGFKFALTVIRHVSYGCVVSALVSACIILPVPLPNVPSRAFSDETTKSLHVGMDRSEVLMILGNPDRRVDNDIYFGYWWTVAPYAIVGGIAYIAAEIVVVRRPRILMFEFDARGKVVRFEELSQDTWPLLNREVEKWLESSPQGKK